MSNRTFIPVLLGVILLVHHDEHLERLEDLHDELVDEVAAEEG